MRVLYTCDPCGLKDIEVQVPGRDPTENVVTWLELKCAPALMADHAAKSPHCHPGKFTTVKIPLTPGSNRVGEETKQ